ncbi:MAG: hypothetical protein KGJ57_19475 [Sphingomonadales bacterium]|nr:hypothetical protein [Sphingomonadales bacterium]MDE2171575.1 hypothetical protein [Sphingomonadales bacterium]
MEFEMRMMIMAAALSNRTMRRCPLAPNWDVRADISERSIWVAICWFWMVGVDAAIGAVRHLIVCLQDRDIPFPEKRPCITTPFTYEGNHNIIAQASQTCSDFP